MSYLINFILFIVSFIAIFSLGLFILSCISSIVNPQLTIINGATKEKNENARIMFLLISSIAWAIVITLT